MKKILFTLSLAFFAMSLNAQENTLDYDKAKINVFFKGLELSEIKNYEISLSPNYKKDTANAFSIFDPITKQNLIYDSKMEVTNGSLSLDNLARTVRRDSFNPHGATNFRNALGVGVANTILELLQK